MTIQEMFDLLRDYRDAVTKVNNLASLYPVTEEVKATIKKEYDLAKKVAEYLPRFTPMKCEHCFHYGACTQLEKITNKDFCVHYEVMPLDFMVR